jgi:predicted component of type VI protein secretion system
MLGSLETNDVVIADESVSRKHLKMVKLDGHWSVVDQGSTNGTFKGDRRLVPGTKEPLELDEFLRLGNETFVALVNDTTEKPTPPPKPTPVAKPKPVNIQEKTRVVALKDIMGAPTAPKKATLKVKKNGFYSRLDDMDKSSMQKSIMLAVLIVILGYMLNESFRSNEPIPPAPVIEQLKKNRAESPTE